MLVRACFFLLFGVSGCATSCPDLKFQESLDARYIGKSYSEFRYSEMGIKLYEYSEGVEVSEQKVSYEELAEDCLNDRCLPKNLEKMVKVAANGGYKYVDEKTLMFTCISYPHVVFNFNIFLDESSNIVGWSYFK